MKKFIITICILLAIAGTGALAAWWSIGNDEKEASASMEEVAGKFFRALAAGEWENAGTYCSGKKMKEYTDSFRSVMDSLTAVDSEALRLASGDLKEICLTFTGHAMTSDSTWSATVNIETPDRMFTKTRRIEFTSGNGIWKISDIAPCE